MLLRNESTAGNWLQVSVIGTDGTNRMGIGSRVNLYQAGSAGVAESLLGCREIGVGSGYASAHEAVAHFGLGERTACDVEVILPHGHGTLIRRGITANQRITLGP
jgi:hypothetical protein